MQIFLIITTYFDFKKKVPEEVNDAAGKDGVPCVWEDKLRAQAVYRSLHTLNTVR